MRGRDDTLLFGELEVHERHRVARAQGHIIFLTPREWDLLCAFSRRPDRILSRDELYREVWGAEPPDGDRSVDIFVRKLRRKLAASLPDEAFIHTHVGLGYRFAAERAASALARR